MPTRERKLRAIKGGPEECQAICQLLYAGCEDYEPGLRFRVWLRGITYDKLKS